MKYKRKVIKCRTMDIEKTIDKYDNTSWRLVSIFEPSHSTVVIVVFEREIDDI